MAKNKETKLTTKQNVHEKSPSNQMIYRLWDEFCEWYINGTHERGGKPKKYAVYVSRWKPADGIYPLPKTILQAVDETNFAKVKITYKALKKAS